MVDLNINLTEAMTTEQPMRIVARLVKAGYEPATDRDGNVVPEAYVITREWQLLSVRNLDEFGQEIPLVDRVKVTDKRGVVQGKGTPNGNVLQGFHDLGFVANNDPAVGRGQIFEIERRSITYGGLKREDGSAVEKRYFVPIKHLANGYVHPADQAMPIWQRKARDGSAISAVPPATIAASTPLTEADLDSALVGVFVGTLATSPQDALRRVTAVPGLMKEEILTGINDGSTVERLLSEGKLKLGDDGTYQSAN